MPHTRDEMRATLRRMNPDMDDASFAVWLEACMAEQAAEEGRPQTRHRSCSPWNMDRNLRRTRCIEAIGLAVFEQRQIHALNRRWSPQRDIMALLRRIDEEIIDLWDLQNQ